MKTTLRDIWSAQTVAAVRRRRDDWIATHPRSEHWKARSEARARIAVLRQQGHR